VNEVDAIISGVSVLAGIASISTSTTRTVKQASLAENNGRRRFEQKGLWAAKKVDDRIIAIGVQGCRKDIKEGQDCPLAKERREWHQQVEHEKYWVCLHGITQSEYQAALFYTGFGAVSQQEKKKTEWMGVKTRYETL
jgi:hypothetical protein